ncbi:MAG: hypothetical protein JXB36_01050 [Gammaproteobacteria bacterium]|nr:hypothetical protein [Gammaproteobacteria bacterium]
MNDNPSRARLAQRLIAIAAIAFGLVTVLAGGRVLGGADPGYVVFRPLLVFNTTMGVVYAAAGILTWRSVVLGKRASLAIFVLNLLVLAGIGYVFAAGGAVAVESLRAMAFRTGLWLILFLGLAWLARRSGPGEADVITRRA